MLGLYDAEAYGFFSDINELADVQPCRKWCPEEDSNLHASRR